MNDELVSYALAVLAKAKGFDEVTDSNTTGGQILSAPTQSLLQRWLREKKGIVCYVSFTRLNNVLTKDFDYYYDGHIKLADDKNTMVTDYATRETLFEKYEDALNDVLIKALELL